MKLLPSLRQKKRYIVFEIIADEKFSFAEVKEEIDKVMKEFWGQLGLGKASPLILKERFILGIWVIFGISVNLGV